MAFAHTLIPVQANAFAVDVASIWSAILIDVLAEISASKMTEFDGVEVPTTSETLEEESCNKFEGLFGVLEFTINAAAFEANKTFELTVVEAEPVGALAGTFTQISESVHAAEEPLHAPAPPV